MKQQFLIAGSYPGGKENLEIGCELLKVTLKSPPLEVKKMRGCGTRVSVSLGWCWVMVGFDLRGLFQP